MKNFLTKYKVLVFIVAGLVYLVGQYFRGVWFFNLPFNMCENIISGGRMYCGSPYAFQVGWPLIHAGEILALVALIVLFANALGFRRWWRFSRWYVPLTAFITFYFFPRPFLILIIDRYPMITIFGGLYLIVTLGIVMWGYFAEWRARRATPLAKKA